MKKINIIFCTILIIAWFSACNNETKETAKQNVVNVNMYVDSLEKITPVYIIGYWNDLDSMYKQRVIAAEKSLAKLDAADKKLYDDSKTKYAKMKAAYEAKLIEQQAASNTKLKETEIALAEEMNKSGVAINSTNTAPDYRLTLRNRLFGEGKIGTDMKFAFVNASNAYSVYKNFVNSVANNKNNYSREDWDEIKVLYEALDTRKNVIEKDLAGSDNRQIALLKVRFATIKATHRAGTKGEENDAAKR